MPLSSSVLFGSPSSLTAFVLGCRCLHRNGISDLLKKIPSMFNPPSSQSAGGAALLGALDVLRSTGGKISMFMACLPNHGANVIKV
jgi:hypothetical protein